MTDKRRGAAVRVAYGSPAIGRAFLLIPVLTILPSVYVQDYGMTSGLVATIILLTRLFDLTLEPGSLLFVYSLLPAFIFTLSAPLLGHPSVYEGQQSMTSTERFS